MQLSDDARARMERFKQACRKAGLKLTHQRIEVFREVASTDEHPDAEKVFRGVSDRIPSISLDTVYRTLWMLVDLGLVATLGPSGNRARFDANTTPHHHFVCTECKAAHDFYSRDFDELETPESVHTMGDVAEVHVEFRGKCARCLAKERT